LVQTREWKYDKIMVTVKKTFVIDYDQVYNELFLLIDNDLISKNSTNIFFLKKNVLAKKKESLFFQIKCNLSLIFEFLRLNDFFLILQKRMTAGGKFIRVINYHCIPLQYESQFEKQLQYYKKHFCDVSENGLIDFLFHNIWNKKKPGLIITFDDGDLSNYLIAAPLLEKYGFTGWFFIPTGFVDCNSLLQKKFAEEHRISFSEGTHSRIAMSWGELKELVNRGHVIGSHTKHHCRLKRNLEYTTLQDEIIGSKKSLEYHLGKKILAFSWVGGESTSYSSDAAQVISDAEYQFSFMTCSSPMVFSTNKLQIQRTNIEPFWPKELMKFQLCGLLDILYFFKRRKVNKLTGVK
jgi:peptidoglycan/xylan/chitin deacetylase (PgdA/CDA1 family)